MTQEDSVRRLAEIRERAEKTTPGPWFFGFRGFEGHAGSVMATWPNGDGGGPIVGDVTLEGDADFICHSREDVPYLLALIDSITAERDRALDAAFERWFSEHPELVWMLRAEVAALEAAEADRERLREALRKVEVAHFDQWCALCLGGEAPALHKPDCPVGAALATPPSEGGTR